MTRPPDDGTSTTGNTTRPRSRLAPPWKPGQTGNPYGRGVSFISLAARVRHATRDGDEIVSLFLEVFRGEPIAMPGGRTQRPTLEQRLQAAAWLCDRGWGRAREIIEARGRHVTSRAPRDAA